MFYVTKIQLHIAKVLYFNCVIGLPNTFYAYETSEIAIYQAKHFMYKRYVFYDYKNNEKILLKIR